MIKAIEESSDWERAKYAVNYNPPQDHTVIVNEQIAQKIEAEFDWGAEASTFPYSDRKPLLLSTLDMRTFPPFAIHMRLMTAEKFPELDDWRYLNVQLVVCLILNGEMDPILWACAHPRVRLGSWHCVYNCICGAHPDKTGWNMLYRKALRSYIGLNVAYFLPDTWEPQARNPARGGGRRGEDYRDTYFYQELQRECTADDGSSAFILCMHRRFFVIDKDRFNRDGSVLADKVQWLKDHSKHYDGLFTPNHYE